MSDLPSPLHSTPDVPELSLESLAAAHRSLRQAFHVSLILLAVLTGSLFVFFLREVSLARRQMSELSQVVLEYERTAAPVMEEFRSKLQIFTQDHPDFAPIYRKYFGGTNVPGGSAVAPGRAQPLSNSTGVRLPPSN